MLSCWYSGTRTRCCAAIEHGTRRMHLGGVTSNPTGEWTVQQARNLALTLDQRFEDIRFLIRDRGPDFTASFDVVFQASGTRILRTAVQAPRMNATCERLIGTLRRELLDRVLIPGERHLRTPGFHTSAACRALREPRARQHGRLRRRWTLSHLLERTVRCLAHFATLVR
jgi:transposase InsO family protein